MGEVRQQFANVDVTSKAALANRSPQFIRDGEIQLAACHRPGPKRDRAGDRLAAKCLKLGRNRRSDDFDIAVTNQLVQLNVLVRIGPHQHRGKQGEGVGRGQTAENLVAVLLNKVTLPWCGTRHGSFQDLAPLRGRVMAVVEQALGGGKFLGEAAGEGRILNCRSGCDQKSLVAACAE
jgi:hypothetical protein